jgi:hypothetical protein
MVACVRAKKARRNLAADKSARNEMAHENHPLSPSAVFRFRNEGGFMKNIRFVLFALAVALMATAARAQETKVRANVPFDFIVRDRVYSAGEYYLNSMADNGAVIWISSTEQPTPIHELSVGCTGINPSAKTKLVFHRMGGQYFLYQVWIQGNLSGREFPKSRTEVMLAQNQEKAELVIVAANISH